MEFRAAEVKTINGSSCCHGNLMQQRGQESNCLVVSNGKVLLLFRIIGIVWADDFKQPVTELVMELKITKKTLNNEGKEVRNPVVPREKRKSLWAHVHQEKNRQEKTN